MVCALYEKEEEGVNQQTELEKSGQQYTKTQAASTFEAVQDRSRREAVRGPNREVINDVVPAKAKLQSAKFKAVPKPEPETPAPAVTGKSAKAKAKKRALAKNISNTSVSSEDMTFGAPLRFSRALNHVWRLIIGIIIDNGIVSNSMWMLICAHAGKSHKQMRIIDSY